MKQNRILIIEDDPELIENYRLWLKFEDFDIDEAMTSEKALEELRTTYYSLVILDLSLDPNNPANRESIYIQKYLQKYPEGTMHIVSSAHAEKEDIRQAAFLYKAFHVFYKSEFEDPEPFIKAVKEGINKSNEERPDFIKQSYLKMLGGEEPAFFENRMLKTLNPKDGATGYIAFKDSLLKVLSPIEVHKTRNRVQIVDDQFVFAIYWSRRIGSAVSLCLTNNAVKDEAKRRAMTDWLGWDSGKEWKLVENNNVKGFIHIESKLEADDFILPEVK